MPYGDDIAVIGTRFGQPGTPVWYHNLRADPRAEVGYRELTVRAVAREARDDERAVIWRQPGRSTSVTRPSPGASRVA